MEAVAKRKAREPKRFMILKDNGSCLNVSEAEGLSGLTKSVREERERRRTEGISSGMKEDQLMAEMVERKRSGTREGLLSQEEDQSKHNWRVKKMKTARNFFLTKR